MKIQKSHIITGVLLLFTVLLMGAIIIIGSQLSNQNVQKSSITIKKTKAQQTSYNTEIPLQSDTNAGSPKVSITQSSTPTVTPVTLNSVKTPTRGVSPSGAVKLTGEMLTITPTEILLANNSTITPVLTITTRSASSSAAPTQIKSLPKTGIITNSLFIFGAAGLLMFVSFIL